MKKPNNKSEPDSKLKKRLAKYDLWIKEGKIPFSSKVIPVNASVEAKQWVLPTEQATEILRNARIFTLVDCECRSHYKRCNNPVDVCFMINDEAEKCLKRGEGRKISIEEAKKVLRKANEHGLVHLTIYNPDQHIFGVCSCCECCCHDLQLLKKFNRPGLIARSDYYAYTDLEICNACGDCIEACTFDARKIINNRLRSAIDDCYGCGICVSVCPENAITMELRRNVETAGNIK
ncbi:MAG: 4Fe-4S binding protein [Bacteroidales bacterium]|nr:MAG: 4Fe-4S binding protein [Bacteroidales bacterium]